MYDVHVNEHMKQQQTREHCHLERLSSCELDEQHARIDIRLGITVSLYDVHVNEHMKQRQTREHCHLECSNSCELDEQHVKTDTNIYSNQYKIYTHKYL